MIWRFAQRLGDKLIRAGAAKEEQGELIAYGLFQLISDGLQMVILLGLSLLLNIFPAMLVFLLCYGSLRRYIGGAHAKSHGLCLALYTSAATAAVWLGSICPAWLQGPIGAALSLITCALVYAKAPVSHPDNPRSESAVARFKVIGRRVAVVQAALVLLGALLMPQGWKTLVLGAGSGGFSAAATLVIPMSKERREKT